MSKKNTVKTKQIYAENSHYRVLMDTFNKIRTNVQPQFVNPLEFAFSTDPDTGRIVREPIIYMVEVRTSTKHFLGIIPYRVIEYKYLISVDSGFWGGAFNKKEVECEVFDRSIFGVAKKEIYRYADTVQADTVNFRKHFV